eukprot:m.247708 g.247708  ORF g.247708 m.247708 type:complete len:271 (+) comp17489_c1_seq5:82-894(+)
MAAKKSIYDDDTVEPKYKFVPEDSTSVAFGVVSTTRKQVTGALSTVRNQVDKVVRFGTRVRDVKNRFVSNIPPAERNPVGLGVIAVAGLTGSFTLPHRPIVRRLFVVPGLVVGSAAFCYPVTTKHIFTTGLAHSGAPRLEDLSEELPSLPSTLSNQLSKAPSLDEVIERLTSFYNAKPASYSETVSNESSNPVQHDTNNAQEQAVSISVDDVSEVEPVVEVAEVQAVEDVEDVDGALVVRASDTGVDESSIDPDFGQSTPEDEDTYPSRR